MVNSKCSKTVTLILCLTTLTSVFALSLYNDGREYDGRDNCNELAGVQGYYMDYYSYEFSIDNVDVESQITFLLVFGTMFLPWFVWAIRKRGFSMTWWRWGLLLATLCAISLKVYMEIWKCTHYGWYDISLSGNDGPAWWLTFKNIGVCGMMISLSFSIPWILIPGLYEIIKGLRCVARKNRRGFNS